VPGAEASVPGTRFPCQKSEEAVTERGREADPSRHWASRVSESLPEFLDAHPVLARFYRAASVVLYGSTTAGVDDEFSDLDVWLLMPDAEFALLDGLSETRFFEFAIDGKPGHITAYSAERFSQRVHQCEMDLIYHLRSAEVITDPAGVGGELIRTARTPMRREVSKAFFFYHYVEMRSEHRACDNPMERSDPAALLLTLPKVIAHSLRAALVLDAEPYPYDKWLHRVALRTPTGRSLGPSIELILDRLAAGDLRLRASEDEHPIGIELRSIRQLLIEAAHSRGIHAPWLAKWYLHMDEARGAIQDLRW